MLSASVRTRLIKGNISSKSERCFENETVVNMGLDSIVGMATCYGLESLLGQIFHVARTGRGANPASCSKRTGFLSRCKASRAWR